MLTFFNYCYAVHSYKNINPSDFQSHQYPPVGSRKPVSEICATIEIKRKIHSSGKVS